MPDEPVFYEEDGNEIIDAIVFMMEHSRITHTEVKLEGGKRANVFWEDKVLKIMILGLR